MIVFCLSGEGIGTGYSFDGLVHWVCGAVASGSALEQVDFRWTLCSVSKRSCFGSGFNLRVLALHSEVQCQELMSYYFVCCRQHE